MTAKPRRRGTGDTPAGSAGKPATEATQAPAKRIGTDVVLEGFLDAVEPKRIYGWVRDPQQPQARCRVEVRLDGRVLGETRARRERRDLKEAGIGDGCHAFEFRFAEELDAAARERVRAVAFASDGTGELVLARFEAASPGATAGRDDDVRLALGRIAAHQHRAFSQLATSLEQLSITLAALERRAPERPRIGDGDDDGLTARLGVLEGMHLRFEQALQGLLDARHRVDDATASLRRRRTRTRWLLCVGLAFAAGLVLGRALA